MGEASANMAAAHWAGLYGCGLVNGVAAEGRVSIPASTGGSPPGVEGGRVGKRRPPVTLLNTDTSNFRAMVQQFTGIPFGAGAGEFGVATSSAVMSFDHRPAATPSPLHTQLFRPQPQQYGGGDMFFHHHGDGFGSLAAAAEEEDRLLMKSIEASSSNTTNGYNFG